MKLYQTTVTSDWSWEYELEVDAKLDYLLWFYFAELIRRRRRCCLISGLENYALDLADLSTVPEQDSVVWWHWKMGERD